jgi:hypothetical protein
MVTVDRLCDIDFLSVVDFVEDVEAANPCFFYIGEIL